MAKLCYSVGHIGHWASVRALRTCQGVASRGFASLQPRPPGRRAGARVLKPTALALPAVLLATLCIGSFSPPGAAAAVRDWDNETGSNLWFEPANWNPNGNPNAGDHLRVLFGLPQSHRLITTDNDGSITIDGPGTLLSVSVAASQDMTVGQHSRGTLNVQNGGQVSAGSIIVGATADSRGGVMVDGSDSQVDSSLEVGSHGAGSLFVTDGAAVGTGDDVLKIAGYPGSEGMVSFQGPATSGDFSGLTVGDRGWGQLTVSRGADVSVSSAMVIGVQSTAQNTVTVQAGKLTIDGVLTVAQAGNGVLSISEGGTVTSGSGVLSGGIPTGGEAVAVVNGGESVWEVLEKLYVGGDESWARGPGRLFVIRGGAVEVDDLLKVWSTGTVMLNQGTIQADTVDVRGELGGAGTVTGNVIFGPGSVLSPGVELAGPGGPSGPNNLLLPDTLESGVGSGGPSGGLRLLDAGESALGAVSCDDQLLAPQTAAVPEPSTLALLLSAMLAGAAGLWATVRQR